MSDGPSIGEYFAELESNCKKLADEIGQAAQQHADGDDQWSCNILAVQHYTLDYILDERRNLLKIFEENGIEPKMP